MKKYCLYLLIILLAASGCRKYLDQKSNLKLVVPVQAADLQALLDNYGTVSYTGPFAQDAAADDFYLSDADVNSLSKDYLQHFYTWQDNNVFAPGTTGNDWLAIYNAVYVSNTVLSQVAQQGAAVAGLTNWNNIKGQALLFRAKRFYEALQIWSLAYDPATAASDLGIPLRLGTDFNAPSTRASVAAGYQQVLSDLKQAVLLLPLSVPSVLRPSRAAAYGLLARTCLAIRDYAHAGLYADSCLQLYNKLIDYNTLVPTDAYPVKALNAEDILETGASLGEILDPSKAKFSPDLYAAYAPNDLRKTIFFKTNTDGSHAFKGNYVGFGGIYSGIATDEQYLIRAECAARQNNAIAAFSDLNSLLLKRYQAGTYVSRTGTAAEALTLILTERRKELLFRGLRWTDIKRLNKEGANIGLTRSYNGQSYQLLPNSLKFALPIPDDILGASGIPQNPR